MSDKLSRRVLSVLAIGVVLSLGAVETADARRGGSFGSRGMRTYQPPRSTFTAPQPTAPIQRSMTSPSQAPSTAQRPNASAARAAQPQAQRGGFLRRWGGPILGGLLAAGLFGMLMGHGFGGAAGLLALAVQIGVVALLAFLAMRLLRRRQPATASAGPGFQAEPFRRENPAAYETAPMPSAPMPSAPAANAGRDGDEVGLTEADFDAFERLLGEVQGAFGREDYAELRERTTPEIMSYLAEELSQNAVAGKRNEVRDVRLLQGDLSEAWSEDDQDFATVAMRYASVDVVRDRNDGRIVEGEDRATETTEIWTFVRERGAPWGGTWKVSAIQDLAA